MKPAGLILAGGEGRRLGGADKALLMLGGRSLLAHVAGRLGPQVARLALSANGDPGRFADFRGAILRDRTAERLGPMAGLLAGLDWLARTDGGDWLVTASVDTPFLPADLVARLVDISAGGAVIASSQGRLHPTCGLWPLGLRPALEAALQAGERRIGRWAEDQGARVADFDALPDPFFNINTAGDLATAAQRL